ncbi:hypothetical protein PIB30_001705 [Stylosanthes scabra]|uniref:DUF4283 domain-containing protein n=1 Tax=Stylosanthes scabra TaxID=79078 RepID=A0ABU6U5E2_9FABA|nr:hypothetical protein [Stylosanthes scabra]
MEHQPAPEVEESAQERLITVNDQVSEKFKPKYYNLVGNVIANKEMNFKAMKATLLGIWGNPSGVSILNARKNGVIVSFKDKGKGIQILKSSPWKIGRELGAVTDQEEPVVDNVLAKSFLRERVAVNVHKPLTTAYG